MTDHVPTVRTIREYRTEAVPGGKGPTATRTRTVTSYLIRCPACAWQVTTGIHQRHATAAAKAHEWQHHPERRPAPEPPRPDHDLDDARWRKDDRVLRCRCGTGYAGAEPAVVERMAEHLSITRDELHALLAPPPPAQPEPTPIDTPPAPAGWGPEYP